VACKRGVLHIVELLLCYNADMHSIHGSFGLTAFELAVVQGHFEVVEWMFIIGDGLESSNRVSSGMKVAAKFNQLSIFHFFATLMPENVEACWQIASENNSIDVLEYIATVWGI
jgi:ankyrin repeat protein